MATHVETERIGNGTSDLVRIQELGLAKKHHPGEVVIQGLLFASGFLSIFTTIGIVFVLGRESLHFFQQVGLDEFFGSTKWQPEIGDFGIWALVSSTMLTSAIAISVALPLGLGSAVYLSEYASERVRKTLKPILEVLAGIPTVVYGYFALSFMTPIVRGIFGKENVEIFNTASAGIVMGIMILPMIASMSEDALSAVPQSLRQAAYGLGSTKFETSTKVVVPAALSGIIAALIIAISRAVGETMIVAIAAGQKSNFTFNPFVSAETMTGYIARISSGDNPVGTVQYDAIFAIGLTLFVITLTLNILSRFLVARFREVYD